jgi:hypothetical protein
MIKNRHLSLRGANSATKQSPTRRWGLLRYFVIVIAGAAVLVSLGLALQIDAPGFACLELTNAETGGKIFAAILRDGAPITLTWRNSLFNLDVTEAFVVENRQLIQTEVTFADPRGLPPPTVSPSDVNDLYHTGGAFSARGLRRPFTRIAYRVGEIGNPKMMIGARVIEFKREVGFGGGIVLTTRAVSVGEAVFRNLQEEKNE